MSCPEFDDDVLDAAARLAQAEADMAAVSGTPQAWTVFCRMTSAYRLLRDQRDGVHWAFCKYGDGDRCTCGLVVVGDGRDILAVPGHRDALTLLPEPLLIGYAPSPGDPQGYKYRVYCQQCGFDEEPLRSIHQAHKRRRTHQVTHQTQHPEQ